MTSIRNFRYYADRAVYYEFGQASKDAIRKDLKHHITTWPNRIYSMRNPPNVTAEGSDFVAEFPMTYTLTNPKGTHSGVLEMMLRLRRQAQTWRIVGIQKKVIRARSNPNIALPRFKLRVGATVAVSGVRP